MAGRSPLSGAKRTYRRRRSKTGFDSTRHFASANFCSAKGLFDPKSGLRWVNAALTLCIGWSLSERWFRRPRDDARTLHTA